GRQVMGMVMPLGKDMLLTPNDRSLIGQVWIDEKKRDTPVVKKVSLAQVTDGFGIAAELSRAEGTIEQHIAFVALGDGRTVYCDSLRMTGEKKPAVINLGTLGVLNDENWVYHEGKRTLRFDGGERVFTPKTTETFQAA